MAVVFRRTGASLEAVAGGKWRTAREEGTQGTHMVADGRKTGCVAGETESVRVKWLQAGWQQTEGTDGPNGIARNGRSARRGTSI
ncbi:hypothetical protein CRG98_016784 [Punica granatum]|uniref:Uncharacterized protein n=1 Tax=Punica granatum TaxID=22663 RepID=A0A2I0K3Y4_PUNGR|nr:hypothetical protein CRG98_016784 [Punica granatum]